MPTTPATQHGIDPAASPVPTPQGRRFPCGVWFTVQLGLQGLFTDTGHHHTPDSPRQPRTVAPSSETHPLDAAPSCGAGAGVR